MGYRHYLYKIKKEKVNKFRNMSLKELKEKYGNKEEDYINIWDLIDGECIFEFGKLYWDDTVTRIKSTGEELFTFEEAQEEFYDYDCHLVGKEALKIAIEIYENKIKEMYAQLNKKVEDSETLEEKYELYRQHIKDYEFWWKKCEVINLEKKGICHSWLYEHLIFELVYLYKSIDFEEYDLIFMGW